ncbi:MAG: DNA-directed RNA polymerase subunit beta [Mollicutes bacterium PWAP]|nr:DNA-directed RNA polymerase subunit beta [Mollicutes bacterium PWAP]
MDNTKNKKYNVLKFGKNVERLNFSKTNKVLESFDFLKMNRDSFNKFIDFEIEDTIAAQYPILSNKEEIEISYLTNSLIMVKPFDDSNKDIIEAQVIKLAKKKGSTMNISISARLAKFRIGRIKDSSAKINKQQNKISISFKTEIGKWDIEFKNSKNSKNSNNVKTEFEISRWEFESIVSGEVFNYIEKLRKNSKSIKKDHLLKPTSKMLKNLGLDAYPVIKGSWDDIHINLVKTIQTEEDKDSNISIVNVGVVRFGEIPLMTSGGSFIINGSEKVIISQLLRSPGTYIGLNSRQDDALINYVEIIPRIGAWINISHKVDPQSIASGTTIYSKIRIDKKNQIPLTTFLRSFGMDRDGIVETFGKQLALEVSFEKEKKDRITTESSRRHIIESIRRNINIKNSDLNNFYKDLFFNEKRYDLHESGRYTLNNKINLIARLTGSYLAEDLSFNGKILKAKTLLKLEDAENIQEAFSNGQLKSKVVPGITTDILGEDFMDSTKILSKEQKEMTKFIEIISVKAWGTENAMIENKEPQKIIGNIPNTKVKYLTLSDIIASISFYYNSTNGIGEADDVDSLINKRISSIGELLQNQAQVAMIKLNRTSAERLNASMRQVDKITVKSVTNSKAFNSQFKSFFNSSQLSQFMDQINPLAEIANKRRITSLGPKGLNRDTAKFEVRDVHTTHYGRICPIETPEGPNIGLILNLATYAKINELGFIQTPFFKVAKDRTVDYSSPEFLIAQQEHGFTFAQSSIDVLNGKIIGNQIPVRINGDYKVVSFEEVDYIDVSPWQMTSLAASAIPFIENNDANRALMGANMQRQAVPLVESSSPLVGTGVESDIAKFSSENLVSPIDGTVVYVDSQQISIQPLKGTAINLELKNYERSNQGSLLTQKPLVRIGDIVSKKEIIAEGTSFENGEMALGKNLVVAFTTWNGYNFEDAVVLSENLVKNDTLTSIHIEQHNVQLISSKNGDDKLTTDIPNVKTTAKAHLQENGIVRIGSEVKSGDVLVGKVSPKQDENPSPEEKLLASIFSKKTGNKRDRSLKVKNGYGGVVTNWEIMARDVFITEFPTIKKAIDFVEKDKIELIQDWFINAKKAEIETKISKAEKQGNSIKVKELSNEFNNFAELSEKNIKVFASKLNFIYIKIEEEGAFHLNNLVKLRDSAIKNGFSKMPYELERTINKMNDDVIMNINVSISHKRKIKVGDKMAGRHGNKGIVSNILPVEDMPHLEDGTPVDVLLNPQGVPSRMNLGQVLELHLGMAAKNMGIKFVTPAFDGIKFNDIEDIHNNKFPELKNKNDVLKNKNNWDGKYSLYDPISESSFNAKISVGVMYMFKLSHMIDDKMHARSVGPYSLITQQPLGGKSQGGGQRFGEMETWAIETYGATNVLQELLTYKSDNIEGRNKVYKALTLGEELPKPTTPESFNVLRYEMRGLGLNLELQDSDDEDTEGDK